MKKPHTWHFKLIMACVMTCATLAMVFSAVARADEGAIRFTNKAFKQVITTTPKGEKKIDYVEPGLVLPGDVILYQITFENISDQVVNDIVINNPIANNSRYRDGSASGKHTDITFSVDGKTFSKPDSLKVRDASGKVWPAKPGDYTAIRWAYKKPLKPGEKSTVSYKTEIRQPGAEQAR